MEKKVDYKKFDKNIQEILNKMCEFVGANIEDVDFNNQQWYWTHSWDEKTQNEFIDWLVEYLKKNNDARNNIMRFPRKNSKQIRKVAEWFVFNYGWKIEGDVDGKKQS